MGKGIGKHWVPVQCDKDNSQEFRESQHPWPKQQGLKTLVNKELFFVKAWGGFTKQKVQFQANKILAMVSESHFYLRESWPKQGKRKWPWFFKDIT